MTTYKNCYAYHSQEGIYIQTKTKTIHTNNYYTNNDNKGIKSIIDEDTGNRYYLNNECRKIQ